MAKRTKEHIPPAAFAIVLESIMDKEFAHTYIQSHSNPSKRYKVRIYLTCECAGFKNHGYCQHQYDALKPGNEWSPLNAY